MFKTIECYEVQIPAVISKLLMSCASKDFARLILNHVHIEYDAETDTTTIVSTNAHIMCIASIKENIGITGDYIPVRNANGLWRLDKNTNENILAFPNYKKVVPNEDNQIDIGTLKPSKQNSMCNQIRTSGRLSVDLQYLALLKGFPWTITQKETPELNSPYVFKSTHDKWELKIVLMPVTPDK